VTLTNTGSRDGGEVAQLYISRDRRDADDPIVSLRAFRRVVVPAGKTVKFEFELTSADFESVNAKGENVLIPGVYTLSACDAAPVPVAVEKGASRPACAKVRVSQGPA
jgi:beta-glucosidase